MIKRLMLIAAAAVFVVALAAPAQAADTTTNSSDPSNISNNACTNIGKSGASIPGCDQGTVDQKKTVDGSGGLIQTIVNTLIFATGFVCVVFIIIGSVNYIVSTGDAGRIQRAKDTILYAIIGLIVAGMALPISSFVINKVGG